MITFFIVLTTISVIVIALSIVAWILADTWQDRRYRTRLERERRRRDAIYSEQLRRSK